MSAHQPTKLCSVEGCSRRHLARGWCDLHYRRWKRTGDPQAEAPHRSERNYDLGTCSVDGCAHPAYCRTWCQGHYSRMRHTGELRPDVPIGQRPPKLTCQVQGCNRPSHSHAYCSAHYQRVRNNGEPGIAELRRTMPLPERCLVDGCSKQPQARGWCTMHYERWRKHGDVHKVLRRQKGRKPYVNRYGYRMISATGHPNANKRGLILEHRLVMSEHIGRPLRAGETVHHRNGDRLDNRIENLELWKSSHPPGQRVADLDGETETLNGFPKSHALYHPDDPF